MNCESSKLYDMKSGGREQQKQQQQRRRRRSVRAHSNDAPVGNLVSTASCGDSGVEVFLVHERSRRQHHHHPHYHHDHLTISSSLSLSFSHNSRNQLRRRKQKGTLVMRGSINDNDDNNGDCE